MTPTLSRRVAQIMDTNVIWMTPLKMREAFVQRVREADTFEDLSVKDQNLIRFAESELLGVT